MPEPRNPYKSPYPDLFPSEPRRNGKNRRRLDMEDNDQVCISAVPNRTIDFYEKLAKAKNSTRSAVMRQVLMVYEKLCAETQATITAEMRAFFPVNFFEERS